MLRAAGHDGDVGLDRVAGCGGNIGRARRSVLLIGKDCSTLHRSWWLVMTSAAGIAVAGMLVT